MRINGKIRAREIRLIDENGVHLGIVDLKNGLQLARKKKLDLVETTPKSLPPICKLIKKAKTN